MCNTHPMGRVFLVVTALVVFILASRLPTLVAPILDIDEADFAVQTATWLSGGKLYVDAAEKKPPLINAVYGAAFSLGGLWNMTAVHIVFALIVAVTGLLIMLAARQLGGNRCGIAALALFAAYQAGYDINDFMIANPGTLVNVAWAGAAIFAIAALRSEKRVVPLFFAGLFIGLSVLAKPLAAAFLIALIGANWWSRKRGGRAISVIADTLVLVVGLAVPLAITAVILLYAGIFSDAYFWSWAANFTYAKSSLPISLLLRHGAVRFGIYVSVSLPLWILAVGGAVQRLRRRSFDPSTAPRPALQGGERGPLGVNPERAPVFRPESRRVDTVDLFLALWLLLSLVICAAGWRFFPQYFLQLVPPLVLMAARGWVSWFGPFVLSRRGFYMASVGIGLVLPMIAFSAFHIYEAAGLHKRTAIERKIADVIGGMTSPPDRIFVWGHSSDIYFYSQRLPASRFLYCTLLTGASEGFEEYNRIGPSDEWAWQTLMEDLEKKSPRLIVDMSGTNIRGYGAYPIEAFDELSTYVERYYRKAGVVAGAGIYLRR